VSKEYKDICMIALEHTLNTAILNSIGLGADLEFIKILHDLKFLVQVIAENDNIEDLVEATEES
jgi:hypothetical protein